MAAGDSNAAMQQLIRSEKTASLARAMEALEATLADLARLDAGASALRAALVAEAGERLWYVVIQREAMGFSRHEVLYDVLRVPAEVRGAMGPRRPRR